MHRERERSADVRQGTRDRDRCKHTERAGLGEQGAEDSERQRVRQKLCRDSSPQILSVWAFSGDQEREGIQGLTHIPRGGCSGNKDASSSLPGPCTELSPPPLLTLVHRPQPPQGGQGAST